MFLRNAWYVAAWDREVLRDLVPITLLGENLVLFRSTSGQPVALFDSCPHRRLPLSMGRLDGNDIVCGYHGLVFDSRGQCKRVPGACVGVRPQLSRRVALWPGLDLDGRSGTSRFRGDLSGGALG